MKILAIDVNGLKNELSYYTVKNACETTYIIKKDDISKNIDKISVWADEFKNTVGKGYMFYPTDCTHGVALTEFTKREDCRFEGELISMAIAGVGGCEKAAYFTAVTMAYDLRFCAEVKENTYYLIPEICLDGDEPAEDLVFAIKKMPNKSYSDMGKDYRNRLLSSGYIPIKERAKNQPALKYAAESPEFRIRMGWKPVPTRVLHQTTENEQPLKVAVDIKTLDNVIEKMHSAGIEKTEICLVGWGKGGHDGRFSHQFVYGNVGGNNVLYLNCNFTD